MPAEPAVKRRRAPRNVYLHGIDNTEEALAAVARVEGLDQEIDLLRAQLLKWVAKHPEDLESLLPAVRLIVHAVATRHKITGPARDALYQNVAAVLATVGRDLAAAEPGATSA